MRHARQGEGVCKDRGGDRSLLTSGEQVRRGVVVDKKYRRRLVLVTLFIPPSARLPFLVPFLLVLPAQTVLVAPTFFTPPTLLRSAPVST